MPSSKNYLLVLASFFLLGFVLLPAHVAAVGVGEGCTGDPGGPTCDEGLFCVAGECQDLSGTSNPATAGEAQECGDTDNDPKTPSILCDADANLVCSVGRCVDATDIPENFRPGANVPTSGSAIIDSIQTVANWVFAIFLAISLIYIILAAFQFVTGGGNPEDITQARQKLIYAAVGIAIALLAAGFPVILRNIVTG